MKERFEFDMGDCLAEQRIFDNLEEVSYYYDELGVIASKMNSLNNIVAPLRERLEIIESSDTIADLETQVAQLKEKNDIYLSHLFKIREIITNIIGKENTVEYFKSLNEILDLIPDNLQLEDYESNDMYAENARLRAYIDYIETSFANYYGMSLRNASWLE